MVVRFTVVTLPALSVPVTVKLWLPTVEVSIGEPFGTVPTQEARPEPSPCRRT